MHFRLVATMCLFVFIGYPAYAQESASPNETVVYINLSEGLEVRKSFIRVDLLASAKGPSLERLNSEIDNSTRMFVFPEVKSNSTKIILGDRTVTVSAPVDAPNTDGPFWTLRQKIIIQGLDQDDVLRFAHRPTAGVEISSISYSVPVDIQKSTEEKVIALGLKSLAARADTVMKSLGGTDVSISNIRISTNLQSDEPGSQPPRELIPAGGALNDNRKHDKRSFADNSPQYSDHFPSITTLITANISATFIVK